MQIDHNHIKQWAESIEIIKTIKENFAEEYSCSNKKGTFDKNFFRGITKKSKRKGK